MSDIRDPRWWKKKNAHEEVFRAVNAIVHDDDIRRRDMLHYLRLYGIKEYEELLQGSTFLASIRVEPRRNNLRYNVVKSVVETAVARIGKNFPLATFLTSGGTFDLMRQAKRLQKYVEGSSHETELREKNRRAFRDSAIMGPGIIKFFPKKTRHGWKLWNERVMPWEILVDHLDGRYGDPRSIYQSRPVDSEVLFERFKDSSRWKRRNGLLRDAIMSSSGGDHSDIGRNESVTQRRVVEAFHLPSGPDAGDGRHGIYLSDITLDEREWNVDWFPYSIFQWSQPVVGFWGEGLAKDTNGIQIEINRLLDKIQRSYHLVANPIVAIQIGSKIVKNHITNGVGTILEYNGVPPTVLTPQPMHPQVFAHLAQLKQDAHEQPGFSAFAVRGQSPPNLESGEALRIHNDIDDGRQADPAIAWEHFHMRQAFITVEYSRKMAAEGMPPSVMAPFRRRSRRWVEVIKWNEVNLAESAYALRMFPTSSLPSSPAGRTATVEQWWRSGFIDKATAFYLLDFPDVEEAASLEVASYEIVLDQMEAIIDEGRMMKPEPYQDLQLAQKLSQAAYLRAKLDRVPEERLELLRRYVMMTRRLIQRATQEAAAAQSAGAMLGQQDVAQLPAGAGPAALPQATTPGDLPPELASAVA